MAKFHVASYYTFGDMNYFLPFLVQSRVQSTDRQTDWRKWCIRAHRASCTGGLNKITLQESHFGSLFFSVLFLCMFCYAWRSRLYPLHSFIIFSVEYMYDVWQETLANVYWKANWTVIYESAHIAVPGIQSNLFWSCENMQMYVIIIMQMPC